VVAGLKTWQEQNNPADRFGKLGTEVCNKEQEANLCVQKKQKTSRSADRQLTNLIFRDTLLYQFV
jgi:hypothetical protein